MAEQYLNLVIQMILNGLVRILRTWGIINDQGPTQDSLSISGDNILKHFANKPGTSSSNLKPFFPQHEVEFLIQRERVKSTLLENIANIKGNDLEALVNYVMADAKQVFLTLIFSNMVKRINTLYNKGFKDQDLPVFINQQYQICEPDSNTRLDCFVEWGSQDSLDFCEKQWIFLAPVFQQKKFNYEFYDDHRLPFLPVKEKMTSSGHFGEVKRLLLHPAHYERGSDLKDFTLNNPDALLYIAIKRLKQDGQQTDIEKFYRREADTLKTMNDLNNKHLIKSIATFTQGSNKYFLFPWANGGNLQQMIETEERELNEDLIRWTLVQILGLCEGIAALHKKNIRHGDIKPSNILRTGPDSGDFNESVLMIADVGLAKQHEEYTRVRTEITTSRYGTFNYEPPEVSPARELKTLSRNYDVWSLGCVFLELIIWTRYGVVGTKCFHKELKENHNSRFWITTSSKGVEKVFPAVESWITALKRDLKVIPPLCDLVQLIEERFLVISDKNRAGYKEIQEELERIRAEITKPDYLFTSGLESIEASRSITTSTALVKQPPINPLTERSSSFKNIWKVTESDWAKSMIPQPNWRSRYPPGHISKTCQLHHRIFDLESSKLGLQLNINKLACKTSECSLCHLLCLCRKRLEPTPEQLLSLRRDDDSHLLKSLPGGIPMISIYSDPVSGFAPPCAQSRLPYLPEYAGPQQFNILKEWISCCNERHDCMSYTKGTTKNDYMPTRVIDVRSSCIRLIETSNGFKGNYIALSHCWGKLTNDQKFCTYAYNIENLKKEIPYQLLPKSFQDAIIITQALGIPYLWIDSLCIIQEDEEDWESEADKMENVFSFAYCTIAASSAASSLDGFLNKRKSKDCVKIQTSKGPLYLAEAIDDFHTDVEQSKLSRRGWVLQERALSRRTIYFTSTQIYWECGNGIICETLTSLRNPQSQILGDSKFPASSLKYYKDDRIRLIQHVNQLYTNLLLTNATDRPKAILGLQSRLAYTFESKANYGIYERYLERTLLWQADTHNNLSRIPYKDGSAIPSWSWMAYTGGIQYMEIPFKQVNWTKNPQNPFGFSDDKAQCQCNSRLLAKANPLLINKSELLKRATIDSKDYTINLDSWKCIVVGINKVANEQGKFVHYVLLVRSVPYDSKTYERVGVGALLPDDISLDTEEDINVI